jgi:hypothetical protein
VRVAAPGHLGKAVIGLEIRYKCAGRAKGCECFTLAFAFILSQPKLWISLWRILLLQKPRRAVAYSSWLLLARDAAALPRRPLLRLTSRR